MNVDSESVDEWVDYIQTLHAREIELSLERVRHVYQALCPQGAPFKVVSVAGTNGKGSTTEILSSIYRASGVKAGKFTSPHLVDFNERFNINGVDVSDAELIVAFRRIEKVRGDTPITYFEYGLLLAVALFSSAEVDIAIMEVGLGGRLDAVNILDADVAIITSIALDHTDWLGDTVEKIAYEKAGIARANASCIVGVREPQASMRRHFQDIGAISSVIGRDFDYSLNDSSLNNGFQDNGFQENDSQTWAYTSKSLSLNGLPLPFEQAGVQLANASLAIRAVELLKAVFPINHDELLSGLRMARLAGRCQVLSRSPLTILDVSHNEASVARLAEFLASSHRQSKEEGRLVAVCGMLKDKEIVASFKCLLEQVDDWHLATINAERGAKASELSDCLTLAAEGFSLGSVSLYDNIESAYNSANETLTANDCLVVFGSFYVAGDIIKIID